MVTPGPTATFGFLSLFFEVTETKKVTDVLLFCSNRRCQVRSRILKDSQGWLGAPLDPYILDPGPGLCAFCGVVSCTAKVGGAGRRPVA